MTDSANTNAQSRILVWDWTVRVFHWATVLLIICMWSTADNHGIWKQLDQFVVASGWDEYPRGNMGWHRTFAIGLLFLLIYRIYWGVFGSTTARFSQFVKGPAAVRSYISALKERPYKPGLGHNPLGALSVIALLVVLTIQLTTGLFTIDVDGLESGPLSRHVDFDTGRLFATLHENSFRALYILIGLHVLAVVVYQFLLKANIIQPMIVGGRPAGSLKAGQPTQTVRASLLRVAIGVVFSCALVWLIWTF